jgi:hypothetical protein
MKFSSSILPALGACLLIANSAPGQISHVFLDTTGDFGVDDNWSEPAKAPPTKPPGIGVEHLSYFYYINGGRTATISAGSPNGSHFEVAHLFPGDSPPSEPPSKGTLIMEGGPSLGPDQFGASLTVVNANRLILGQRANMGGVAHGFDPSTGDGEIIMNGASEILADGIVVGERDRGYMFIGPDARVRSGRLEGDVLIRQDFRIGSFGPSRGETEPIPVRLEGDGLVVVQGELIANTIYMPESGATGELRLEGGDINLRSLRLNFETDRASRSSKVSIIGSQGSFTVNPSNIGANHSSVTFSYTADAHGVVPIVGNNIGDIDTANLVLNLDAFQFTPTSTMMLLDVAPDLLFGEFGNVSFVGNTTATVNYDVANGDVFLNNFQRTLSPLAGDFNENGLVTGADLTLWRNNAGLGAGASHMQGDADADGDVDGSDFLVWQRQVGMSQTSTTVAAVPEPAVAVLLVTALASIAMGRRR